MSKPGSELLILGLHRVGTPPQAAKIRGLFISPQLLSFQLSLVQKMGFRFATLKQAMANPQDKNAVITFDDGYADNFTQALPILKQFKAPATVFVITGDVGQKNVVWKEAGDDLPADIMGWEMLAQLQNEGWEIGSHAHEHIHLARYTETEQEASIKRSLAEIRKNLGVSPVSFAYPYGSYNETTKKVVKRLGLKYAVTINAADTEDDIENLDPLELSRCSLGGRKFHHYLKSLKRTSKAVGKSQVLKSLIKSSSGQKGSKEQNRYFSIFNPADNDIVP